jgi:hypothetical protein
MATAKVAYSRYGRRFLLTPSQNSKILVDSFQSNQNFANPKFRWQMPDNPYLKRALIICAVLCLSAILLGVLPDIWFRTHLKKNWNVKESISAAEMKNNFVPSTVMARNDRIRH